ncbi:MAG: cyclic nucleotide-binding domain-containing protein [Oligoflexus sp.]
MGISIVTIEAEILKQYPMFANLSAEDYALLSKIFRPKTVPDKQVFIHANEISHSIFLIVSGSVSIELPTPDTGRFEQIAKLSQGDTVGEFILAKESRRSATVRSLSDLVMYESSRDELLELFEQHPRMGLAVYRNLAEILVDRIRDTNMLARNALGVISRQF